jgi:rhamnulokinase
MAIQRYVAFDLGAESGRSVLGTLAGGRLEVRELARFRNEMVRADGHLRWDVPRLLDELKAGLRACAPERPDSIGIDTWGVDFGLLGRDGKLVELPVAYRDARTDGAMERFFERVPRERLYELTGIQMMQFNTVFQLDAMARGKSPALDAAAELLFMPDLLSWLLTGTKQTEFTIATTSQLYDPRRAAWAGELFGALGVPVGLMQPIVEPGTVIGAVNDEVRRETGLGEVPVVASASHDTASAVAAAPGEGDDWAYISSGTWSLLGVELREPMITPQSLASNFTNEGGVGGTFRFLRNMTGLWLLNRCREAWVRERVWDYDELVEVAASAPPFAAIIDPDDHGFLNPPDMPEAIRAFCTRTGQAPPEGPAATTRCILESLALKYRFVLERLRQLRPKPVRRLHIIGGGARNRLLSQFAANATGLPVVTGPVEATAVGNMLVQAFALGHVASPAEIRAVVQRSFRLERYEPQQTPEWQRAYERLKLIVGEAG